MTIVSDSSPLILYSKIGRLDLLRQLFSPVLIPPAVYHEVVARGGGRPAAAEVAATEWIELRSLERPDAVHGLVSQLDLGEAEAIALANELGGRVPILLDDLKGRRYAQSRGLRVFGSAGALLVAKEQGLIDLVRPVLDQLRFAGLRLDDGTYRRVLGRAREGSE